MGAVVSCIEGLLRAIGACLMAIVNGIGAILQGIVSAIVAFFDILISCLTCGGGGRRRHRGGVTTSTVWSSTPIWSPQPTTQDFRPWISASDLEKPTDNVRPGNIIEGEWLSWQYGICCSRYRKEDVRKYDRNVCMFFSSFLRIPDYGYGIA